MKKLFNICARTRKYPKSQFKGMRMLIDSINRSYFVVSTNNQYFFSRFGIDTMTILLFSFLLTFFSIDMIVFFFHNLKYRLSMNEVLRKVIRLISCTDLSSRNTVQFFFLDSVSWIRVGWCAKKEWRMRKKKSISFDYDQARFRPVRVSFKQFSVQSRLLWFFLPFSTFLFFLSLLAFLFSPLIGISLSPLFVPSSTCLRAYFPTPHPISLCSLFRSSLIPYSADVREFGFHTSMEQSG